MSLIEEKFVFKTDFFDLSSHNFFCFSLKNLITQRIFNQNSYKILNVNYYFLCKNMHNDELQLNSDKILVFLFYKGSQDIFGFKSVYPFKGAIDQIQAKQNLGNKIPSPLKYCNIILFMMSYSVLQTYKFLMSKSFMRLTQGYIHQVITASICQEKVNLY